MSAELLSMQLLTVPVLFAKFFRLQIQTLATAPINSAVISDQAATWVS